MLPALLLTAALASAGAAPTWPGVCGDGVHLGDDGSCAGPTRRQPGEAGVGQHARVLQVEADGRWLVAGGLQDTELDAPRPWGAWARWAPVEAELEWLPAPFGGAECSLLPLADGRVLALARERATLSGEVLLLEPGASRWTPLTTLPEATVGASLWELRPGELWVVGGGRPLPPSPELSEDSSSWIPPHELHGEVQVYELDRDRWRTEAALPEPRAWPGLLALSEPTACGGDADPGGETRPITGCVSLGRRGWRPSPGLPADLPRLWTVPLPEGGWLGLTTGREEVAPLLWRLTAGGRAEALGPSPLRSREDPDGPSWPRTWAEHEGVVFLQDNEGRVFAWEGGGLEALALPKVLEGSWWPLGDGRWVVLGGPLHGTLAQPGEVDPEAEEAATARPDREYRRLYRPEAVPHAGGTLVLLESGMAWLLDERGVISEVSEGSLSLPDGSLAGEEAGAGPWPVAPPFEVAASRAWRGGHVVVEQAEGATQRVAWLRQGAGAWEGLGEVLRREPVRLGVSGETLLLWGKPATDSRINFGAPPPIEAWLPRFARHGDQAVVDRWTGAAWVPTGPLVYDDSEESVGVNLASGELLLVGGDRSRIERYDPDADAFVALPPLDLPHFQPQVLPYLEGLWASSGKGMETWGVASPPASLGRLPEIVPAALIEAGWERCLAQGGAACEGLEAIGPGGMGLEDRMVRCVAGSAADCEAVDALRDLLGLEPWAGRPPQPARP